MRDVDVDPIGAEVLQAFVDRPQDVTTRQSGLRHGRAGTKADLRRDHNFIATRLERLAEQSLGLAVGVGVGGIEEVHAGIERTADQLVRDLRADLVDGCDVLVAGSKGHRAEREARDDQTGVAERGVPHDWAPGEVGVTLRWRAK
jgi:hypothetical protein